MDDIVKNRFVSYDRILVTLSECNREDGILVPLTMTREQFKTLIDDSSRFEQFLKNQNLSLGETFTFLELDKLLYKTVEGYVKFLGTPSLFGDYDESDFLN